MIPSHMSLFVTNDIWQKNTKRFEYNSFKPAVTLGKSPLVLVASSRSNVNTPQEFVKYITNGKPVNVAVGGGAHRMAFEYIVMKTGANPDLIKDIRFQGPLPAVTSVAQYDGKTGTEFGIMPIAIARPLIDAGKVKLVGLTGSKVPEKIAGAKLLEESVPGISVYAGWMVSLPPGTAKEILDWYQREFSRAIKSKEYQDWARDSYILSPEDQLTTEGVKKYAAALRKNFAPIIAELSKPKQNK
jgi:tripartite-type tricarboxylate transporter receptor subunit TctC